VAPLIDVIGTFNGGTANFAADETLRRKPSISAPNVTLTKQPNGIYMLRHL
jgi:hypothetical protein